VTERGRLRVVVLMFAAGALAVVLVGRLLYWQVAQHTHLALVAERLHQATVVLPATRGSILDRAGNPLAFDTPVYDVFAVPDQIPAESRVTEAQKLAPLLGEDPAKLLGDLSRPQKFEYLARRVDQARADQIQALGLLGIGREASVRRTYIPGDFSTGSGSVAGSASGSDHTLASNLLGFLDFGGDALYGVEQFYDSTLRGKDGVETTLRDGLDQTITLSDQKRVEPVQGKDVELTLDSRIQFFAEKALREAVDRTKAESGSVLVMEPHTGAIVAWADYPTFDANQFQSADPSLFSDNIVSSVYEPGSVMKVVTLSGGLDDGAITPTYTFDETGGVSIGRSYIRDWDFKAHGNIDMTYVLAQSLNVGAIKVLQLEGPQNFYAYLDRFGFGRPTGIDVKNEVAPPLRPLDQTRPVELATMSFGQGIDVTPIQMISAVNAVANGGVWVRPHVGEAIIDPNQGARRTDLPVDPGTRVISQQTADEMRQMMIQVVEHGSGHTVQMPGWTNQIAGKTGTANIPDPKSGKYLGDTIASFIGFMPANNPRFTMLVVVRRPKGDSLAQEGTFAAAPTWKEIAQQILLQWQITP
jgi:cell division protein FtsI/penicillin-binding protein 2